VRWYVNGFSRRSGIQVHFTLRPGLGRLPRQLELTLYRIVQEALTNVHRHSGSSSASISLLRDTSRVALEIMDYGRGLRSTGAGDLGVGIAGMRERVEQLEGEFAIDTSAEGTAIQVVLPIPAVSSPSA
jgi:two-component system NarL family sensor kinase